MKLSVFLGPTMTVTQVFATDLTMLHSSHLSNLVTHVTLKNLHFLLLLAHPSGWPS